MFFGAPEVVGGCKFNRKEISASRKNFGGARAAKKLRIIRWIVHRSVAGVGGNAQSAKNFNLMQNLC